MLTASDIIDRLGGTSTVAAALDVTPSVVSSWRSSKGHVPHWWREALAGLPASDPAKRVTLADFPPRERVSRVRATPQADAA